MNVSVALRILCLLAALGWGNAHSVPVPGQGTWESTLHPRDINRDGSVDAFYDSALNITWLADWNYLGVLRNFESLGSFVPTLNILGLTGWRLPSALNSDGTGLCSGFNCTKSEFGHLWYVELGNSTGPATNTANFVNMQSERYWTNTLDANIFFAWVFSTADGFQGVSATGFPRLLEFVRDGDVSPVPEAPNILMLATGLVWLWQRTRRRFGPTL